MSARDRFLLEILVLLVGFLYTRVVRTNAEMVEGLEMPLYEAWLCCFQNGFASSKNSHYRKVIGQLVIPDFQSSRGKWGSMFRRPIAFNSPPGMNWVRILR